MKEAHRVNDLYKKAEEAFGFHQSRTAVYRMNAMTAIILRFTIFYEEIVVNEDKYMALQPLLNGFKCNFHMNYEEK